MLTDFYLSLSFGYCYNTRKCTSFKLPAGGRAEFIFHCCVRGSWMRPGEKVPSISYLCPVKLFLPLKRCIPWYDLECIHMYSTAGDVSTCILVAVLLMFTGVGSTTSAVCFKLYVSQAGVHLHLCDLINDKPLLHCDKRYENMFLGSRSNRHTVSYY